MKPQPATYQHPILAQIDGMIAQLRMLRADYEREIERRGHDEQELIKTARGLATDPTLTSGEVAAMLGISLSAIQRGVAGTECLFRGRIKNGRSVRHLRKRVELHRRNLIERHQCGDCDRANLDELKIVRRGE